MLHVHIIIIKKMGFKVKDLDFECKQILGIKGKVLQSTIQFGKNLIKKKI